LAFAQDVKRAVDLPERACDLSLANARRSGEHHVSAHRRHRQALFTTLAFDLDAGEQLVDLFLNRSKADHPLEFVQHLVGAPYGGHRGVHA
jgi:hypothetical protein